MSNDLYAEACANEQRRIQAAKSPQPPPELPPLSEPAVEQLRRSKVALETYLASLASHDAKVREFEPLREKFQVAVRAALTGDIGLEDAPLLAHVLMNARLELVRLFLANASATRSQICACVENELTQLTARLKAARRFSNTRPPNYTEGHSLESRIQFAIGLIETLVS